MIRSMTGFGEAEVDTDRGRLAIQIRTVNHRSFNAHFRVAAPAAERWEADLTRLLRERIVRGNVHVRVEFRPDTSVAPAVVVDDERVRAYVAALRRIKEEHDLEGAVGIDSLVRLGDVFRPPDDESAGLDRESLLDAMSHALDRLVETREQEGTALRADLEAALASIDAALSAVAERAPERLVRERDRLRDAIRELAGEVPVDEDRLAREIAYLAERWDINEEIVRLRSHLDQFRAALESEAQEPVGKRLGFWVQEMHREANTIGSKANDPEIAVQAVEIKTAIEKLREQVENVE